MAKSAPVAVLLLLALLSVATNAQSAGESLMQGATIDLDGRTATLRTLETLPFVESEYTKRFKFDSFENPKLAELRQRGRLDEVIAPGKDEFDQQVRLMDWTHRQFKKFGRPSTNCHGALQILQAIDEGHTFFCAHYANVLVSAAASLGWVDRSLALRRHQGANKNGGSTEHSVTEIWSNQHRKWVMLDPTSNMYLEKDGVPLTTSTPNVIFTRPDGDCAVKPSNDSLPLTLSSKYMTTLSGRWKRLMLPNTTRPISTRASAPTTKAPMATGLARLLTGRPPPVALRRG